jgi:hypothetical protein
MKVLNQQYHVVFKGGKVTVRRPWKGKDEELYSSSGDPENGIPAMFGGHEERQFLEKLGPFTVVSVDAGSPKGSEVASRILDEGYEVEDPDTHVKSKWYVAGYYVRDDGVVYIMTPEPMDDKTYFNRLGLRVDLENDWGNSFKVGKYLKRLYSHHRKYIQGEVVSRGDGSVIFVRLPSGKMLSVRYADYGSLTDGMNLVSTHCMKMLGLKRQVGQGLRMTALSSKGFSKGHAIVVPDLRHDLVLFNSKKLLFGEQFTLGVDWLHAGGLFTDVQSVVNFRMYRTEFMQNWFTAFGNQIIDALQDEGKLREMLNFFSIEFHKHTRGDEEGDFIEKEKDWALLRALRGGVDHKPHPGLVRKLFHLFTDKIADCERLRVPVPSADGGARYAIVDPTIFDVNGDPTLEGVLHGNQVYCPGHTGELVFHRQPNAHRGEHHIATSVQSKELEAMDAGHFMFLSRDMVATSLGKLGGGDQDDRLVYYTNPQIVEHFKQLELDPYPVQAFTPDPVVKEDRVNTFVHRLLRTPVYDRQQLLVMLSQQKKQGVSIGYAVNAIINDTILTDEKSTIMDFMISELPKNHKNNSAIQWLEKKPDYQLRNVTSRLEVVIDAVKKTGSDLKEIGEELRMYNATFEVVPKFCTTGGKFEGRVPSSRRNETYPVIVRCTVDKQQDELHTIKRDLEDIVTRISWQMLQPLPLEILTCPAIPEARHLMRAMRENYIQQWRNLNVEIPPTGTDREITEQRIDAYVKIDGSLYRQYKDNPMIVDAMVHLYMEIYDNRQPDAPLDENGKPKAFPDGILWGPRMSGLTMRALERAGMAGRYVQASIDPEFKKRAQKTMEVEVYKNLVMDPNTGEVIGGVEETIDNTTTTMNKGFIKVKAPGSEVKDPDLMLLTVVNGMESRGASPVELAAWLSHAQAQKKVELVPYIYINKLGEEEHAVRVMLDSKEYGHLTRKDSVYVTERKEGWLLSGKSLKTVSVIVKK